MSMDPRNERIPVPIPEEVWNYDVEVFAWTFNAYIRLGSTAKVARVGERVRRNFEEKGTLPSRLDDLRAALFYEQRQAHWATIVYPDPPTKIYLRALLQKIYDVSGGSVEGPSDPPP